MTQWMGGHYNLPLNGSTYSDAASAYVLTSHGAWNYKRSYAITPSNAHAFLKMPDARLCPTGAELYYFQNMHADTLGVKCVNHDGTLLAAIAPQNDSNENFVVVCLSDNSSAAGVWHFLGYGGDKLYVVGT